MNDHAASHQQTNNRKQGTPTVTSGSALADRVRAAFSRLGVAYVEKRMMGGLCFMVDDKMCLGVNGDRLMVRLDPDKVDWALEQSGCRPMDFTGRPMRGFVWVDAEGHDLQSQLGQWIDLALEYNPRAKSSKKPVSPADKQKQSKRKK